MYPLQGALFHDISCVGLHDKDENRCCMLTDIHIWRNHRQYQGAISTKDRKTRGF